MSLVEYLFNDFFDFDTEDDRFFGQCSPLEISFGLENYPSTDVYESSDYYKIIMEVPGVQKNDLRIESDAERIEIRMVNESKSDKVKSFLHLKERSNGDLIQSINFSTSVDPTQANVTLEDGILTITVPKAKQSKKIPLKLD